MLIFNDFSTIAKVYFIILIFVLGAVFGSFCNAWAWRIVHKENIAKGRSHCASCGHVLSGTDLVPIFSYIILKGRCRYCHEKISPRYLIVEIICSAYFVTVFLVHGFTVTTIRLLILGCILLVASLVDLDIMELPDGLMIAGAVIAFARLLESTSILVILIGLIPAVALLVIVLIMDRIMKKDTMGGGDIKLMAVLGLNFGAIQAVLLLLIACVVGLLAATIMRKGRDKAFPFGPMLSIAAWITALIGTPLVNAYLSLF